MASSATVDFHWRFLIERRTRLLSAIATLIYLGNLGGLLWGQTGWQTGTNTIYAPTGVNVGIGTASPLTPLDVRTSANGVYIARFYDNSGTQAVSIFGGTQSGTPYGGLISACSALQR